MKFWRLWPQFFVLAAFVSALTGCAVPEFQSVTTGPRAELIVEGRDISQTLLGGSTPHVYFLVSTCGSKSSSIDLTYKKPVHTTQIPADGPFLLSMHVSKGNFQGGSTIVFIPRVNSKYKLIFSHVGLTSQMQFFLFDKASATWKPESFFKGNDSFKAFGMFNALCAQGH